MTRLSVTHALALRRLAVAGGALAASLVAHLAAAGDLVLTPAAPAMWAGLLAIVTMVGARRGFRPRGLGRSLAAMAAAQALVHVAMTAAPWAFGLAPHHPGAAMAGPAALLAHGAAVVALALLATRLEEWLARALAAVAAVRRWLSPRPVPAPGGHLAPARPARGPRAASPRRPPCRGPPRPRPA